MQLYFSQYMYQVFSGGGDINAGILNRVRGYPLVEYEIVNIT